MTNMTDLGDDEETSPNKFPEAYGPFLPVINRLSSPLRQILQGHLQSLESIFQTVQKRDSNLKGDFEGVGGLTHRGEMSRILQSELLLRTEAPMEFLRRVAEKEALYMETEHSDPGEKLIYRLMISVGPNMLGHGRIVALASLLFLARIARARKTELHWCYLPHPDKVYWFNNISVNSVKRFLKFGSFSEATIDDIEAASKLWDDVFAAEKPRDLVIHDWLIGAEHGNLDRNQSPLVKCENALILNMAPPVGQNQRLGFLNLKSNGANVRRVSVAFPNDNVCMSALNRPFAPISPVTKQSTDGVHIPKLGGWEPRHILSCGHNFHIIRFENYLRGLLFIQIAKGFSVTRSHFLPLPEDVQLAGVYGSHSSLVRIIVQRTRGSSEELISSSIDLGNTYSAEMHIPHIKSITSAHLFARQRAHAIPILSPGNKARCYTTLGQAFDFVTLNVKEPIVEIQYKENRILYANGMHKIVEFDPSTKLPGQREQIGVDPNHIGKSICIIKGSHRHVASYPVNDEVNYKQLRSIVYSLSSRGIAYCVHPGHWKIFQRGANSVPSDYSHSEIVLPSYERVLSSHITPKGVKVKTYSDISLGGSGTINARHCAEDRVLENHTLIKLGSNETNLSGLNALADGNFWGVDLDEHDDPQKLVVISKPHGNYKKHEIDLEAVLKNAVELNPETVFGR